MATVKETLTVDLPARDALIRLGVERLPKGIDADELYTTVLKGGYLCTVPVDATDARARAEMRARGKRVELFVWRHWPERVRKTLTTEGDRLMLSLCPLPKQREERKVELTEVYVDGCCEPNPSTNIGIGVYTDDWVISETPSPPVRGTSNVAECLAAIRALEECRRRGVKGVRLLTDSQLLTRWVNGTYQIKSATGRRYVPAIRELLAQVSGSIRWIPGKENKADAPSRHAIGLPGEAEIEAIDPLDYVRTTPFEQLRFADFKRLKVGGSDRFSRLGLSQLAASVSADVSSAIVAAFPEDRPSQEKALRWVFRGLDAKKAIRKVRIDMEISGYLVKKCRVRSGLG
jgi:ribonuclease HI